MKRQCSIDGCKKFTGVFGTARGYCGMHYRRWRIHGDPHTRLFSTYRPQPVPVEQRFAKCYVIDSVTGCWNWIAAKGGGGYGKITVNARSRVASRVSWEMNKGNIPKGLLVCHKCDNRACVNPDHLFLGTTSENAIDAAVKQRKRAKLSEEKVRFIRASDEPHSVLGRRFGVSPVSIAHVRNRRIWAHVP